MPRRQATGDDIAVRGSLCLCLGHTRTRGQAQTSQFQGCTGEYGRCAAGQIFIFAAAGLLMGSTDGDAVTVLIGNLVGCRSSYACCRGHLANGLLSPAEGFIGACGRCRTGGQFEFQKAGRRIAVGIIAAVEADCSRYNRPPALCAPFNHGLQLSDPRFLLVSHG